MVEIFRHCTTSHDVWLLRASIGDESHMVIGNIMVDENIYILKSLGSVGVYPSLYLELNIAR